MSRTIRLSALLAFSIFSLANAQCGGMMGNMNMMNMMNQGMGGMSSCCPQPVQLMMCPPQQQPSCSCPCPPPPCPIPVQLMMCPMQPKPCCCEPPKCCPPPCCPQPMQMQMQQPCCPPPCCPMMDQPKPVQLMLIPTGQEVMMPCPKPCCCPPQMGSGMMGNMMNSGGCGGMMGRKRRSIALYRRNGLYERLAKGSSSNAAFGSNFAHHPKAQAPKYGSNKCVPCVCTPQLSAPSPLNRILNPKFLSR